MTFALGFMCATAFNIVFTICFFWAFNNRIRNANSDSEFVKSFWVKQNELNTERNEIQSQMLTQLEIISRR